MTTSHIVIQLEVEFILFPVGRVAQHGVNVVEDIGFGEGLVSYRFDLEINGSIFCSSMNLSAASINSAEVGPRPSPQYETT